MEPKKRRGNDIRSGKKMDDSRRRKEGKDEKKREEEMVDAEKNHARGAYAKRERTVGLTGKLQGTHKTRLHDGILIP